MNSYRCEDYEDWQKNLINHDNVSSDLFNYIDFLGAIIPS